MLKSCASPCGLPADRAQVADLCVEQRNEGGRAERTAGVEVGVVGRPAGHDLLVINQGVAAPAQRAT